MSLFGFGSSNVVNADLECEPKNDFVTTSNVAKIDKEVEPGEKIHYLAPEKGIGVDLEGYKSEKEYVGEDFTQKKGSFSGIMRTIATDKRVLINLPKLFGSDNNYSIPYGEIKSVDLEIDDWNKKLVIETDEITYHVDIGKLTDEDCRQMTEFISEKAL